MDGTTFIPSYSVRVQSFPYANHILTGKDQTRFWKSVNLFIGGCWEWLGQTNHSGYGRIWLHGKLRPVHQLSFFMHNGFFTPKFTCHSCDNRICVNPDHLWSGDNSSNMLDMWSKRRRKPERHLTFRQAGEARDMYGSGKSRSEIAKALKVHPQVIYYITIGKTYRVP